jgi:hypothetical protein
METCKFKDFLKVFEPWLDGDYIRKVFLTKEDHLVFNFSDGGQKDYFIDDCSKDQLKDILRNIQQKGIALEKEQ